MWRKLIETLSSECTFFDPATPQEIADIEATFKVRLPEDMKSLLLESNGVFGSFGLGMIWSTEGIKERNLEIRQDKDYSSIYMPFTHFLFFGDDGAGDYYGFAISAGNTIRKSTVFRWYHEIDGRMPVAYSLEGYLKYVLGNVE